MMFLLKNELWVVVVTGLLLQGCGGGGDSQDNEKPQGFWQGTADNGRTSWGAVQPNGRYFMILSSPSGTHALEAMMYGTFDGMRGTSATSSDSMTIAQNNIPYSVAGTGSGLSEFRTRNTWTGRMDGSPTFINFQMQYVNDGLQTSSLSQLARSYVSWPVAALVGSTATMTVTTGGAISGAYFSGCNYTGQATPTSQQNVYDLALTLSGSCNGLTGSISGMLFHDAANSRIFAVAGTNRATGTSLARAFMFVGQ